MLKSVLLILLLLLLTILYKYNNMKGSFVKGDFKLQFVKT